MTSSSSSSSSSSGGVFFNEVLAKHLFEHSGDSLAPLITNMNSFIDAIDDLRGLVVNCRTYTQAVQQCCTTLNAFTKDINRKVNARSAQLAEDQQFQIVGLIEDFGQAHLRMMQTLEKEVNTLVTEGHCVQAAKERLEDISVNRITDLYDTDSVKPLLVCLSDGLDIADKILEMVDVPDVPARLTRHSSSRHQSVPAVGIESYFHNPSDDQIAIQLSHKTVHNKVPQEVDLCASDDGNGDEGQRSVNANQLKTGTNYGAAAYNSEEFETQDEDKEEEHFTTTTSKIHDTYSKWGYSREQARLDERLPNADDDNYDDGDYYSQQNHHQKQIIDKGDRALVELSSGSDVSFKEPKSVKKGAAAAATTAGRLKNKRGRKRRSGSRDYLDAMGDFIKHSDEPDSDGGSVYRGSEEDDSIENDSESEEWQENNHNPGRKSMKKKHRRNSRPFISPVAKVGSGSATAADVAAVAASGKQQKRGGERSSMMGGGKMNQIVDLT